MKTLYTILWTIIFSPVILLGYLWGHVSAAFHIGTYLSDLETTKNLKSDT